MFLSRRTAQEEYFDSERPVEEVAEFFDSLNWFNRLFDFSEPFRRIVPQLVPEADLPRLSILDVGAGDGSLGRTVRAWAAKRGWNWRVVSLDSSLAALSLNHKEPNVAGSAVQLPFCDCAFDVVLASQMAHHLSGGQAKLLLQEAWRVTRQALVISDLHRNLGLYLLLWTLVHFQRSSAAFKADALISVKRAWRVGELAELARQAKIPGSKVSLYFGARVILTARKTPPALPRESVQPLSAARDLS